MQWITGMEETMSDQISNSTSLTKLSEIAEQANASGAWWKSGAMDERSQLELPARVLKVLEGAGITTVEQLKAAGPARLRKLDGLGKLAFNQIIELLRALDRQNNGGDR
jgi:DNA-directed RNA polymerase alpha subunit